MARLQLTRKSERFLNRLNKRLQSFSKEVIKEELENWAIDTVEDAKVAAPNTTGFTPSGNVSTSTGNLRQQIGWRPGSNFVTVESKAPYSSYVEYGTRFQKAQPYLEPAVTNNLKATLNRLKQRAKNIKP